VIQIQNLIWAQFYNFYIILQTFITSLQKNVKKSFFSIVLEFLSPNEILPELAAIDDISIDK
jgi:hypothetical protein